MLVKFFATYRKIAECESFDAPALSSIYELLHFCSDKWPEFRNLLLDESGENLGPDLIIMVNGRHIQHLDGINTKLNESDVVAITPQMAGG